MNINKISLKNFEFDFSKNLIVLKLEKQILVYIYSI